VLFPADSNGASAQIIHYAHPAIVESEHQESRIAAVPELVVVALW
jgi:hypothetical protein